MGIFPKFTSSAVYLLILLISWCSPSIGYSTRNVELPTPRVVVIPADSNNPTVDEIVLHKPPNSQLIVGEGEEITLNNRIKLECDASYPIQFIYTGDGMPEYTTNTSQSDNERSPEFPTRPRTWFEAHLFLGYGRPLGHYDTGKYTCRSLQDPTKAVHYYLFVSDGKLFIRRDGEKVYYKRSDSSVRIPCSVAHPNAVVSLQKVVNGLIQCPLNDSISFEPTSGFHIKTNNRYFDPSGTYVCTAGRSGVYQAVEYELVGDGPQPITDNADRQPCRRHADCESSESCLNNGHCGSPCGHSCGQNTSCRVVNHSAKCQCFSGYVGDPYKGCSHPEQQHPPPSDLQEQNPCNPFPCGTNTRCENHHGVAKCSCAPGYQGDPYYRCYRRQESDPCNPNPCGPHSVCLNRNNYASCSCSQGFVGTPPHCRAECEVDYHCASNQVCHQYKCRNPCDGACHDIPNTQCRVINRRPVCARYQARCPIGYYGRECSKIYVKEDTERAPPSEASSEPEEKPISPCVPYPCGANAECVTRTVINKDLNKTSEVALCQCGPGKTGNADMECYPVEEQKDVTTKVVTHEDVQRDLIDELDLTTNHTEWPSSSSTTTPETTPTTLSPALSSTENSEQKATKKCGTNAIAIFSADGKSICSCPVGYTGLASIECHAMMLDDEPGQKLNSSSFTDVGNDIVEPEYCDGSNTTISCGHNAYCVVVNGSESCMCMRPFKGNPDIGCELECTSDSNCPSEYTCYSGRCVDPCEPGLQMFFKSCGRDAYCKAEDHKPVCYCPKDLPHGNPEIHCKEKSWMPNHLPPSPLAACEEKKTEESCGKNAECRMFHDSKTYCVCMPGYFGDPYDVKGAGCEQGLQCRNSTQCPSTKECVNGRCLDPCRTNKIQCGEHAGCGIGEDHKPKCICNIGTIRNPDGSCVPVKGALAERMALFRSFEDF